MKIALTGATGFLGQAIAHLAVEHGHTVVGFGRNVVAGKMLEALGVHFVRAELHEVDHMRSAMQDCDAIVHAAALSSPWGSRRAFVKANVEGTRHVCMLANELHIPSLVHVSSASVYACLRDQFNVKENMLPSKPINAYAQSKMHAERVVQSLTPHAVVLRPRAIFGRGDTVLFPRILRVAQKGSFPLFRDGQALIDVSYVDDVAQACLAGIGAPSGIYSITQGQPITVKELLTRVFALTRTDVKFRHLPLYPTLGAAWMLEKYHQSLKPHEEPIITPYGVGALAFSQTLDISRALHHLNWRPQHTLDEALHRSFA